METKEVNLVEATTTVDLAEVEDGKDVFLSTARACATITNDDEFRAAGEMAKEIKRRIGMIDKIFGPILEKNKQVKAAAEAARKAVQTTMESLAAPFVEVDSALRLGMTRYQTAKEAAERAEWKRLEGIARKEAEDARLAEAEATGDLSVLDAPIIAAPVAIEKAAPAVEGVNFFETWHYQASGEPLDPAYTMLDEYGFPVPDHKKIKKVVTELHGETQIRGVKVYSEKQVRIAA